MALGRPRTLRTPYAGSAIAASGLRCETSGTARHSRRARTYTDRHGLKYLLNELVGVDVSKQQQTSDWGAEDLSDAQLEYAASDVLHLHKLKEALEQRLRRENRLGLAQACFDFLPARAHLDLLGWSDDKDIFNH